MSEPRDLEPAGKVGRPLRVLSEAEKARLSACAALGLSQVLAGARIGVPDRTLREILKRDDSASLHWYTGRAEAAEKALNLLWRAAEDGQPAAMIFLGKCLAGLRETGSIDGEEAPPAIQINFQIVGADGTARPLKRVNGEDP